MAELEAASNPHSSDDFSAFQARSRSKMLVGALAIVAVIGGGVAFASHSADKEAQEAFAAAAGAYRGCLLRAPLQDGETPLLRLRRLQLQAMGVSDSEAELKRADVWPLACHDEAIALKDMFRKAREDEASRVMEGAVKFSAMVSSRYEDPSSAIEPVLRLLDEKIPGAIPQTGELPPVVLNQDSLRDVAPVSKHGTALGSSQTEDNPGPNLPVLIAEESLDVPFLCSFSESGEASCKDLDPLKKVKGQGFKLLGTSDESAKTLIFAGRRGSEGIFVEGEKEPLGELYGYGGFARADGSASVLGWDQEVRKIVLLRRAPGQKPIRTELNPNFSIGNAFYNAGLLWEQVLVRGVTPDNERRLFSLPLDDPKGSDFSLVDIGVLSEPGFIRPGEEEQTHISGCRTDKATIVRVRGRDNDFVTFRIGEKFTLPVYAPTWGTLGCHGTTATLVKAGFSKNGTKVYYAACTSAGCEIQEFPATAIDRDSQALKPNDERFVQAVDLAGNVVVVWRAGDRGGLRMRMAKPALFEQAQDKLLFDDRIAEGKLSDLSSILGFRLYSREKFGVLLLSTIVGLHAFRISPTGEVTPFAVSGK